MMPDGARARMAAEALLALLYPRRCPLCGAVLGAQAWNGAVCPDCAPAARRLRHRPPRLPATEHSFYAVSTCAGAFYYTQEVRRAILLCKQGGRPWYARELADLTAVLVFGAQPAVRPGRRPVYERLPGLPLYSAVVPVPPRVRKPRGGDLPELLAQRLGAVLGLPVLRPLALTRRVLPQKSLDYQARLQNVRDAYACRPGTELSGQRLLLVDDIVTTGATISACAMGLLAAGAVSVDGVCVAAAEELPRQAQGQKPPA